MRREKIEVAEKCMAEIKINILYNTKACSYNHCDTTTNLINLYSKQNENYDI